MIDDTYRIVSVEPADPPRGASGSGWHCYVIGQGDNRIRGYQQGMRTAVMQSVEEIIVRLNERRYGKRGRVHLEMSNQSRKPATK